MFKVGNRYLMTSVPDIISVLRSSLAASGVKLFSTIRTSGTNIQVTCPFHNNGQERRPSCGITCIDKEVPAGTVHCFTCGWSGTLQEMISGVLGYDDNGIAGTRWLIKTFAAVEVEQRPDIKLDIGRQNRGVDSPKFIPEDELDSYRYYHPYLEGRGLTEELCDKFDIGYDHKTDSITMPVRDENGNCLFVARRGVKSKFFNYPKDVEKPVYGLYEIGAKNLKEILICESIFNAMTAFKYGRPAVALLGTGDENQYKKLLSLPCRKYVLALDPDEAGERGCQRLIHYLGKYKILTKLKFPAGKDVNDLSLEEFKKCPEIFC